MFTKKAIGVTIALAEGVFEGSNNEITLPEVPTHVSCDKTGGDELPKCTIEVKNLKLDLMQRLTVLAFRKLQTYNNVIKVMAGDYGGKLDLVFQGEIVSAVPDFGTDGSVTFKIEAMTGFYPLQLSTAPVSVQGYTTIESLMAQFAKEAGYAYENSGVSGSVKNSVYRGSPIQKARQLARQTGIDLLIQDGKFITLPDYDTSRENVVPYFTKDSGLLGYPSFTSDGIECTVLFSPLIEVGGLIKIGSIVPKASGVWKVTKVHHDLDAYSPAVGTWVSDISATWVADE